MDCTLEDSQYMGLSPGEASAYCLSLIREVEKARGELSLLWHNSSLGEDSFYHRELYSYLITRFSCI
jgi:hypothetical protein